MKAKLFLFVLGALFGFLVAVLFQPFLRPLVTDALRGKGDVTEGRVIGKRLQGERLLMTVDASEGTILATFTQRVPEIDLLVQQGDILKLGVGRYEPFVEDPPILAVRKPKVPGAGELLAPAAEHPGPPAEGIVPAEGSNAEAGEGGEPAVEEAPPPEAAAPEGEEPADSSPEGSPAPEPSAPPPG